METDRESILLAKRLINALSFKFDLQNFENPTLQRLYSILQALVLREEEPEFPPDTLEPDTKSLAQMKDLIDSFKHLTFDSSYTDIDLKPSISYLSKRVVA